MSIRPLNHKEANWAIREIQDKNITSINHHFLFTALSFANKQFIFQKSYQHMAKIMRCHRDSIRSSVNKLCQIGYLSIISKGSNLKNQPTIFCINMDKILSTLTPHMYKQIVTIPQAKVGEMKVNGVGEMKVKGGRNEGHLAYTEAIGDKQAAIAPDIAKKTNELQPAWLFKKAKEK
jgi:hypothetical protein